MLSMIMAGHETVIHAAAQKHIPAGERNVNATYQTNVVGSINVIKAAIRNRVQRVVGVSTDKVCYPANTYGFTKALMERLFQEAAAEEGHGVRFHLCRYGNVIGSTGLVIPYWQKEVEAGRPIRITDPYMTRFWLTEDQAVDTLMLSMTVPSGHVIIPLAPACDLLTLANAVRP